MHPNATVVELTNENFAEEWTQKLLKAKEYADKDVIFCTDSKWNSRGVDTRAPDPKVGIVVLILQKCDERELTHHMGRAGRHEDHGHVVMWTLAVDQELTHQLEARRHGILSSLKNMKAGGRK